MDVRGAADFVRRDWVALAEEKQLFWARRLASADPVEAFEIAEDLRREAQALHPDWPSADERLEDLRAHQALSELMRRASPNGPG